MWVESHLHLKGTENKRIIISIQVVVIKLGRLSVVWEFLKLRNLKENKPQKMLIKPLSMKLIPTDQITRILLRSSLIRPTVVVTHKKIKWKSDRLTLNYKLNYQMSQLWKWNNKINSLVIQSWQLTLWHKINIKVFHLSQ